MGARLFRSTSLCLTPRKLPMPTRHLVLKLIAFSTTCMKPYRTMSRPDRFEVAGKSRWWGLAAVCLLAGCAGVAPPMDSRGTDPAAPIRSSLWSAQSWVGSDVADAGWVHQTFGDRKPTSYRPVWLQGRPAVLAHSVGGNSSLRKAVDLPPGWGPQRLRFSWFVPRLNEAADLRDSDIDDAVARVVLGFDGDRAARFTVRDHLLSELSQLVTGEPLPYATLIYVWDNRYPVGTVIANPHTTRIRQLVVESGPSHLGRWVDIERDVQADFRMAFDEPAGPLRSLGILSDANNTGATVDAWYGPVTLTTAPLVMPPPGAVSTKAP